MNARRLLGLLTMTLGASTWAGDASAVKCGISFPCPSDIDEITDSNGNIVTDIYGAPASRTVSEVGEVNQLIQVYIGAATITGTVYLTEGPVTLQTGLVQASDVISASTVPDPSGVGNDVAFLFQSDGETVPLAYVNCTQVACVAETGQLQDLTSYFSMSGASLHVLASSDATDSAQPGIFWANNATGTPGTSTVGAARLDGTFVNQNFVTLPGTFFGVAFDGSYLYWSDVFANTIGRSSLDRQTVDAGFRSFGPAGIAFDGSYVYWTNVASSTIGRANRDWTGVNQSFITGANGPSGVAVDGSYIYWANNVPNTIARANRDGTGVNESFITGANAPRGVAVDGSYLYWANASGTIGRASRDGSGVDQNFITGAAGPSGVAVDGSYIYWTNGGASGNTIGRANRDGSGVNQNFITGADRPTGVAVLYTGGPAISSMVWLPVLLLGNPPDSPANCFGTNCGSVAYAYDISQYQVTNAQYAEFLNAKAASDPLGLYNRTMGSDLSSGGITQNGVSGSFTYSVNPFYQNKPVNYVSFYSALRFANWLNNGKGNGDTESGSYTLLGGTPTPSNASSITRNPGAKIFLPSENEWYKAAYYSPGGTYFAYPYGTNIPATCAQSSATPNTANCNYAVDQLTDVGSYTASRSPFGTYDQGGNVEEWTEGMVSSYPIVRGAAWSDPSGTFAATIRELVPPSATTDGTGFRLAALDSDGDGVPDLYDNCPFAPNPDQKDSGGIGTGSPPDGIGDACQCGDANNDGIVDNTDAVLIKRSFVNLPPYSGGVTTLPGYHKCQVVNGAPGLTCNNSQATIIQRAVASLAPGIVQGCHAATIFP